MPLRQLSPSGDRFAIRAGSIIPKAFVAANYPAATFAPASEQTLGPAAGHLVKQDVTVATPLTNDAVRRCLLNDTIYGVIESINSSSGTLSVIKLTKTVQMVFELIGTPVIGHGISANGSVGSATSSPVGIPIGGVYRDQVKDSGGAGNSSIGIIVAGDQIGATQWLVRVEFG